MNTPVFLGLILCIQTIPFIASASPDLPPLKCNDLPLLQETAEKLAAARLKLGDITYSYTWEHVTGPALDPDSEQEALIANTTTRGASEVVISGNLWYKSTEKTSHHVSGDSVSERECAVLSKSFLGFATQVIGQRGNMQQFDIDTNGEMSERASALKDILFGNELIQYGFGDGTAYLDEHLRRHPDANKWNIFKQEDGLVRLQRFSPVIADKQTPDCEWFIDPNQGWLIVRVINRGETGEILFEININAGELQPGIWFPTAYTRNEGTASSKANIASIQINTPVRKTAFEWEGFGTALEGYAGFREMTTGETRNFVVQNGVPIEAPTNKVFGIQTTR